MFLSTARLSLGRVHSVQASLNSRCNAFTPLRSQALPKHQQIGKYQKRWMATAPPKNPWEPLDKFVHRHLGPRDTDIATMLQTLGYDSLDSFTGSNVPKNIQMKDPLRVGREMGEIELLQEMKRLGKKNKLNRSFIGMGYYGTVLPKVILRNVLENPGWYTPYTPYQAEIAQGRLEALLNFQTMICDMTKLDVSNASLLDEATAAGEALYLCYQAKKKKRNTFYVDERCHPQSIALVQTRAEILNLKVEVGDVFKMKYDNPDLCGIMVQYPDTNGRVADYEALVKTVHDAGALVSCASDLLALGMLKPPGEFGVDICFGSAQRFGVPMGYGGPHAAFFAVKDEHKRIMPGRLIGVSKDSEGKRALRMALQTREQHIRRETATSNICTAQALLANISTFYAIYHGPGGIKHIASRVHQHANALAEAVKQLGFKVKNDIYFDTVSIDLGTKKSSTLVENLLKRNINIRTVDDHTVNVALDESVAKADLQNLFEAFAEVAGSTKVPSLEEIVQKVAGSDTLGAFSRTSPYLTHPNFNRYHSETEMMRFLKKLENKDISLVNTMIALGSCTMKLNAATEMIPVTWPEFSDLHPFVPLDQAEGYMEMFSTLSDTLKNITGFAGLSLQPNSGSQGEYTGLRVIRAYQQSVGEGHRTICLIPESAHGTNPASAVLAGMKVVVVKVDHHGNVDMADLTEKAKKHSKDLCCLMVTYPSTHGVFEESVKDICTLIHSHGGQVYMDGANMNSQVGLCSPGGIGADVCHLNLHKTFCIPHGGGGPGMGPIGVAKHLVPFLPAHPVVDMGKFGGEPGKAIGPVSAAPFGSSSILPISHAYIEMMGSSGLKKATQVAILNANYMANQLRKHYKVVYAKENGLVAHEFILDFRPFKKAGLEVEDIAKRLIDYGFHSPTMAWPIHDTLMIEPTESEPKEMLDRMCTALILIREEIRMIEEGKWDPTNNPLKNAPHTAQVVTSDKWDRPYSRELAAYPAPWLKDVKYWPPVSRLDGVFGDRNLVCSCPPMDTYE